MEFEIGQLVEARVKFCNKKLETKDDSSTQNEEIWVDAFVMGKNDEFETVDLLIPKKSNIAKVVPLAYQVSVNDVRVNLEKTFNIISSKTSMKKEDKNNEIVVKKSQNEGISFSIGDKVIHQRSQIIGEVKYCDNLIKDVLIVESNVGIIRDSKHEFKLSVNDPKIDCYWLACCHYAKLNTGVNIKEAAKKNNWENDITETYTAALLAAANGDGELHPHEKDWILGHQAAFGVSADILEKADILKDIPLEDLIKKIEENKELQACRYFLIYHCLCASMADGILETSENETTKLFGKALGLDLDTMENIKTLVLKEKELYDQKMTLLWKNENPWPFQQKEHK